MKINRMSWLKPFICISLLVCPFSANSQMITGSGTASPDHVTLSWTDNPSKTMTVTWRTDTTINQSVIQYQKGTTVNQKSKSLKATMSVLTTDMGISHIFSQTLNHLDPNTQYTYRVGSGRLVSANHTFQTEASNLDHFKFLIFGDSQSYANGTVPYGMWRQTLNNAYASNPDAKFLISTGDIVDIGQNGAHWNAWFKASTDVIDRIPFMPATGNHETYGLVSVRQPYYWMSQFTLPTNGPKGLKEKVYSYDYGPVHFVVLDSQDDEEKMYGDILAPQKKWLEADLAASKAIWKIAYFHKTPYDIRKSRDNPTIKSAFCPILEKYHVDVVFNGHDHGISRTLPMKNDVSMQKPSQGTIYYVVGRSGTKTYKDLEKKAYNTYFYDPQDQPNYLVVDVNPQQLSINVFKQDRTLLNNFFLDKQKDISSDNQDGSLLK
jgi:acid phosphatase type 7